MLEALCCNSCQKRGCRLPVSTVTKAVRIGVPKLLNIIDDPPTGSLRPYNVS